MERAWVLMYYVPSTGKMGSCGAFATEVDAQAVWYNERQDHPDYIYRIEETSVYKPLLA